MTRIKERNKQIGTCPCPVKGCDESMAVYQFRGRENTLQRRLAGKFYGQCPVHGRIGADGKQATIDYIAEYMQWLPKSDGTAPEKEAEKASNLPTIASTSSPPQSTALAEQIKRRADLWSM